MARDYKHRAQPRSRRPPVSGWAWFFAGMLVGALGIGALWWKLASIEEGEGWIGAPPQESSRPAAGGGSPKPPKPKFDFYTLLPEMEVIVPDDELDSGPPEPPARTPPAEAARPPRSTSVQRYLIQVASFRKPGDAETLKAKLALLGFEAHVQRAASGDGVWHRVRTGPFASVGEVQKARAQLASNGLKGYVVRLSGP